jgi:murein DD-endopeptidase MepM/ murein hydrolase activator NlpD
VKQAIIALLALTNSLFQVDIPETTLILPILGSTVLSQYEAPLTRYGSGHRGIDLVAEIGAEVLAPASGELSFAGVVGYRSTVTINFANSMSASMEPVCSAIAEGSYVLQGEAIGTVCEPDLNYHWHCAVTCLHFGTRTVEGYFSPLAIIGGLPFSRLVPLGD